MFLIRFIYSINVQYGDTTWFYVNHNQCLLLKQKCLFLLKINKQKKNVLESVKVSNSKSKNESNAQIAWGD